MRTVKWVATLRYSGRKRPVAPWKSLLRGFDTVMYTHLAAVHVCLVETELALFNAICCWNLTGSSLNLYFISASRISYSAWWIPSAGGSEHDQSACSACQRRRHQRCGRLNRDDRTSCIVCRPRNHHQRQWVATVVVGDWRRQLLGATTHRHRAPDCLQHQRQRATNFTRRTSNTECYPSTLRPIAPFFVIANTIT